MEPTIPPFTAQLMVRGFSRIACATTALFLCNMLYLTPVVFAQDKSEENAPKVKRLSPDAASKAVDTLVQEEMKKKNIPAVSLLVLLDGKVVKKTGYGFANVETNTPATPNTIYQLASVTKQFTATAVLMLMEEGKVKLEEPFLTYLTDFPAKWQEKWKGITVRQLLNHTSGIVSYTSLPDFPTKTRIDYKPLELLGLVGEKDLEFTPGSQWNYDNTGYFLLGMLIEKVSGKSYGEFLTERIFRPLGMKSTRVNDLQAIIPNRATGYSLEDNHIRNGEYTSPTQPFAAGALVSSVADMEKWAIAVDAGKLLKPETWTLAFTPTKLTDGKTQDYGFGWELQPLNGHTKIGHGGGITGFSTYIMRLPQDKVTIVALCNQDHADPEALSRKIAGVYVPEVISIPRKAITDPDPERTKRLRGILEKLAKGEGNPDDFAPDMQKFLFPERIKEGPQILGRFGPFKNLELLSEKEDKGMKRLDYRATFGDAAILALVTLTPDGKIAGIGFRPE